MAKITRISANTRGKEPEKTKIKEPKKPDKDIQKTSEITKKDSKTLKTDKQAKKLARRAKRAEKWQKISNTKIIKILTFPLRIIFAPLIKFAKYFKSSWTELRQVKWPSRKTTWKTVGIVLIYTALFMVFITILDAIISVILNQILKK